MAFSVTWMDLEIVILNEVSQTQKNKYMISLICGILKNDANELIYETETDSIDIENKLMVTIGERVAINQEFGINRYMYYIKNKQ